jgi:hypothetical protein
MMLWMSLIVAVALSAVAALQWQSISQDRAWGQFYKLKSDQQNLLDYDLERQHYLMLKRHQAYIKDAVVDQIIDDEDPEKMNPVNINKNSSKGFLQEKGSIPLNARLPVGKNLYNSIKKEPYRLAFWRLLDELYSKDDKLGKWLNEVDRAAFLDTLLLKIEGVAHQSPSSGSLGLSGVIFEQEVDQQAWYRMIKGSDWMAQSYPSLIGFIWPISLAPSTSQKKLNIVHADVKIIVALLGVDFANEWTSRISKKFEEYNLSGLPDPFFWPLSQSDYRQILQEIIEQLSLNESFIKSLVDLTLNATGQSCEALIRTPDGLIKIIPFTSIKAKKTNLSSSH